MMVSCSSGVRQPKGPPVRQIRLGQLRRSTEQGLVLLVRHLDRPACLTQRARLGLLTLGRFTSALALRSQLLRCGSVVGRVVGSLRPL
jgi:hypothetical protein